MNNWSSIRSLYTPIQPTIRQRDSKVSYQEIAPALSLQQFIYCYWQLKTSKELKEPFNYRVVADGCIDIFFSLDKPDESFVMGFCKKYTEFPLDHAFNYVGIRFLPTMFPQLFNMDASELSNRYEWLKEVIPTMASFIEGEFSDRMSLAVIKEKFDDYFTDAINHTDFDWDNRVYDAISLILKHHGTLDVTQDLETGISERQLRRLFKYYIGDSAKTFSKVVRFQNILRAKPSTESLKMNKLFYDVGYYDQAHFIKDFKNFYGVTPSRAFR